MTKIEKFAMECASGKHGDAYDAAKCACLELGEAFKEYLEKTRKQYTECNNVPAWITLDKIINELFKED